MSQRELSGVGANPIRIIDATAGSETYQLPSNFAVNRRITIRRTDSSTNSVTIAVPSGQSLNGVTNGTVGVSGKSELDFVPTETGTWLSLGGSNGSNSVYPQSLPASQGLGHSFQSARSAYNVTPGTLKRARAAAAKAFAGLGRFEICCLGTSLTAGTGASNKLGSWPTQLQKMLVAKGYPDGGSGLIPAQSNNGPTPDGRTAYQAGWAPQNLTANTLAQCTTAGATATFTDTKPSTIVEVWFAGSDCPGATWTIDGVAQTDIAVTNAATMQKVTVSGLSSANHTVVITPKAGTDGTHVFYLAGVAFKNATGVVVHNLGIGGATIQGMITGNAQGQLNWSKTMTPALTFWEGGANNGTALYPAFQSDVTAAVNSILANGSDAVLVAESPNGKPDQFPPSSLTVPLMYAVADATNTPLIDMDDRLVSWASLNALGLGYATDGLAIHLNQAGYAEYARAIVEGLAL